MGNSANLVGAGCTDAQTERQGINVESVGQCLDRQIEMARKRVEDLCIRKAKLEAMNMLNHPMAQLMYLLDGNPF